LDKLLIILTLLFSLCAWSVPKEQDRAILEGPERNLLTNPGYEARKAGVTASGGVVALDTADPLDGKISLTWDSDGSAQTLDSGLFVVPKGMQGATCGIFVKYMWETGSINDLKLVAHDGSSPLVEVNLSPTSGVRIVAGTTFTCPSSGSMKWRLESTVADPAIITLDVRFLGTGRSNGSVANEPTLLENLGIKTSISASALTISVAQKNGSTDPSVLSPINISFRDPTIANGGYNIRSITGVLNTVISSGSTAGHTNNAKEFLYIYLLDNSGTVEIAWSSSFFDDGSIVTTTAEGGAGGADSATTLFSTTARSNVPIRLIKKIETTQVVAGTWDALPTEISERSTPRYTLGSQQIFTSSGTWTRPSGCIAIIVEVQAAGGGGGGTSDTTTGQGSSGGGGGGGGYAKSFLTRGLGATETITIGAIGGGGAGGPSGSNGGAGGTSSFGSHLSATGGNGGVRTNGASSVRSGFGGTGGIGSNGNIINTVGGSGHSTFHHTAVLGLFKSGHGGSAVLGGGAVDIVIGTSVSSGIDALGFGGGGSGAANGTDGNTGLSGGDGAPARIVVWEFY